MKKRNLLSMIVALSLVGVIMIGATLAYLTDTTEEVVNTFTIGNVKIELTEPNWEPEKAQNLEPGAVVPKNPIVTNIGKNEAYVLVSVDGMTEMAENKFSAVVNAGWQKVDKEGNFDPNWTDRKLVDGYYAYTTSLLTKDQKTAPALFDEVKFDGDFSYEDKVYTISEKAVDPKDQNKGTYFVIDGQRDAEGDEIKYTTLEEAKTAIGELGGTYFSTKFDLKLKAYAIQTDGFKLTDGDKCPWVKEFGLK